jgi:LmbE family N-acetylglucosaminyl deacetylase
VISADVTALEEMPSDWTRCLAIVPHPDDMEYGASAAVAVWTDAGKSVSYLLVTRGEAGIDDLEPAAAAVLRAAEQRAACDAVGVQTLEFLDFPDGTIEYGLPLRHDLAAAIRRHRPELVVTVNHRDTYPGGGLNMADHRVTGQAVVDAVRDAGNRWVFPDLIVGGLHPWPGVRWIALAGSPKPTHAVDITGTLDRGVASLAAHRRYLASLGASPLADPESFLRGIAEETAARFGGRLATTFEVFTL